MNNYINYYYNLYPKEIHNLNKKFVFYINNDKYYFTVYERSLDDIKYLYELDNEMLRKGIFVHEIVLNKEKQPLTFINNIPYILLKIYVNEYNMIDLAEVNYINDNSENIYASISLHRSNWISLWSDKVDYFEYQISQVGKKFPVMCESFSYFIGLAENAIAYVKDTTSELKANPNELTACHKRLNKEDTFFELYNQ